MKKLFFCALLALAGLAHAFDATDCDLHFSPLGGTEARLVAFIDSAKYSVRVLAYNFTSPAIADALVRAHERHLPGGVEVVLDRSVPTERGTQLPTLLAAGVPAWVDKRHKIAHNKVILIDGEWFKTGSFNYTANAEKSNGENALICRSPAGAAQYLDDFKRHQDHSEVAR